jgi:predicted transcriptional regulator
VSTTIRISDSTKARIDSLAAQSGLQIQALVDVAIAQYERAAFFDEMNRRFSELRADEPAWKHLQAERVELDGALADWAKTDPSQ